MNTIEQLGEAQAFAQIVGKTISGDFVDDILTSIGSYAFKNCSSLTSVNFPKVTSIGDSAFDNCTALTTVILRANQVASLGSNAFYGSNNASFYVPDDLVDQYKVANNWSSYASRIKGISELPSGE